MQDNKKRLFENFLSLGFLNIAGYIFPLITLPYQTRVLGIENFGIIAYATSFIQYFILFTNYGFEFSAVRSISTNRHNNNNLSNIFCSVLGVKIILSLICFIVLLCLVFTIPKFHQYWFIFLLSFSLVVSEVISPNWFFIGMERMKLYTGLNMFARFMFMISLFALIKKPDDYIFVPILTSLGGLISGILGLIISKKRFKIQFYIPHFSSMLKHFKNSTSFFFSRLSIDIFTNTNTFCLGLTCSALMVGYYAAAYKIYWAVHCLICTFSNVMFPYMSKNKDLKFFKQIYPVAVIGNLLIAGFVFIFAKKIILIFYGPETMEAYKILRILCFTLFLTCFTNLLGYDLLGAFGYIEKVNKSIVIGSFIHLILLLVLYITNHINMFSVAYLVLFTNILLFSFTIYLICKYKVLKENK